MWLTKRRCQKDLIFRYDDLSKNSQLWPGKVISWTVKGQVILVFLFFFLILIFYCFVVVVNAIRAAKKSVNVDVFSLAQGNQQDSS